jgi:hypothetical protein
MPGGNSATQLAYAAAAVALLVYAIGLTLSFRLPEPKQEALRNDKSRVQARQPSSDMRAILDNCAKRYEDCSGEAKH